MAECGGDGEFARLIGRKDSGQREAVSGRQCYHSESAKCISQVAIVSPVLLRGAKIAVATDIIQHADPFRKHVQQENPDKQKDVI